MGSGWIKLPPESVDIPANLILQQLKPDLPPETLKTLATAGFAWGATNWSGACDSLCENS
jgi:hypothetical protein